MLTVKQLTKKMNKASNDDNFEKLIFFIVSLIALISSFTANYVMNGNFYFNSLKENVLAIASGLCLYSLFLFWENGSQPKSNYLIRRFSSKDQNSFISVFEKIYILFSTVMLLFFIFLINNQLFNFYTDYEKLNIEKMHLFDFIFLIMCIIIPVVFFWALATAKLNYKVKENKIVCINGFLFYQHQSIKLFPFKKYKILVFSKKQTCSKEVTLLFKGNLKMNCIIDTYFYINGEERNKQMPLDKNDFANQLELMQNKIYEVIVKQVKQINFVHFFYYVNQQKIFENDDTIAGFPAYWPGILKITPQ